MFWLNLIALLILTAGHTELQVTLVNRLHSGRLSCGTLRWIRHAHDVLIPLFPVVLFWFIGIRGPGLLTGGSWADLPVAWSVYLAICALGAVGLAVSIVRWNLRAAPNSQASNHSRTVDLEERLGFRPLGDGLLRLLTRVPGNEIFRIQIAEKEFRLPRLPVEWDGLSILHLSDLHLTGTLDRPFFEQIVELAAGMRPDLVAFTGDLLDRQDCIDWLPETLGRLEAPLGRFFVLGNHDWFLDPDAIRERMVELGWQDTAGKTVCIEHKGRRLAIGGTELPWMGTHPDFAAVPDDAFRLLLSHTPDNLPWARQRCIDLMLAGHNHGGQVILPVIGPVYSPSRFGVCYSAGAFWEQPTLLYVTRGISGKHPLRWRCPPELTKLILRAGKG